MQKNKGRRTLHCSAEESDGRNAGLKGETSGESQPTFSSQTSSPTPWPASSWPRPSGSSSPSPVCRECRGRGVISSAAGPLPCPACISWRRRPDKNNKAGQPLLSVQDTDTKSLDQTPLSSETVDSNGSTNSAPEYLDSGSSSGEEENNGGNLSRKPKDRRGQNMTEQKRLAIKQAMQGRGPLDLDHKRRISNAMRERYASNPSLRQAGKAKKCSHCGQIGHNIKKCPELAANNSASSSKTGDTPVLRRSHEATEGINSESEKVVEIEDVLEKVGTTPTAAAKSTSKGVRLKKCSVCGELGHNKRSCPQVIQQQKAAAAAPAEVPVGQKSPPLPAFTSLRSLPGSSLSLAGDGSLVFPLPSNPEQCVSQAAGAVICAWGDGIRRLSLELLLPQAGSDFEEGWPGGIRQQFRAALPMIESLLLRLKRSEGLEGRITAEWIDEGDCVGAWQSEKLAAVVFPTADSLKDVRRIDDALSGNRLILVVNPQWQPEGQVVSDFGFGKSRRAAERYVASLDEIYYLRRIRVLGDEVRVLRCYPSRWQVHYVRAAGDTELISVEQEKPTYQRVLKILQGVPDSRASKSWIDRALDRNFYDNIAAYREGSPQQRNDPEDESGERGEDVVRDIVTGEIIRPSGGGGGKARL